MDMAANLLPLFGHYSKSNVGYIVYTNYSAKIGLCPIPQSQLVIQKNILSNNIDSPYNFFLDSLLLKQIMQIHQEFIL